MNLDKPGYNVPMRIPGILGILGMAALSLGAAWDPRLAANYLDHREEEWLAWQAAKTVTGATCISCHTGAPYLLARPALRRVLGEKDPTPGETALLSSLRARVAISDAREIKRGFTAEPMAVQALGVEAVYASLFLTLTDTGGVSLNSDARKAFDRLWTLQNTAGPSRGAWPWFNLGLDPYEMPVSPFYGAALAALAVGSAPAEYRALPAVQQHIAELNAYFARELQSQPLHNRLMLLWASGKLPDALPETARQSMIDEIWRKQEADGGWTIASLGPWDPHPGAPVSPASSSYATGLVASVLQAIKVPPADPGLARALAWLASHQDRQAGYWEAQSMNKVHEPGSMPAQFMRDAATGFAALALSESWEQMGK